MTIRWTEEQYQSHRAKKTPTKKTSKNKDLHNEEAVVNKEKNDKEKNLQDALSFLGLTDHIKQAQKAKKKSKATASETEEKPLQAKQKEKAKRRGVSTKPIFDSLQNCNPFSDWGEDWLAINMPGARVLTYNEMFSILQYRKFEAFRYKKICREIIKRALCQGPKTVKPFFDGPTRLTLLRIGTKEMDNDALPVVFKYFIDAVKKEKDDKNHECAIIDDDNPEIIVDIQTIQGKGEPRLALMLKRLEGWSKKDVPTWQEWVDSQKPTQKVAKIKKTTKKTTKKTI